MEKRTKTFQTSPYQAAKIKRLIWEFIINLWAYVVVKKTKFSEFLDRGGRLLLPLHSIKSNGQLKDKISFSYL